MPGHNYPRVWKYKGGSSTPNIFAVCKKEGDHLWHYNSDRKTWSQLSGLDEKYMAHRRDKGACTEIFDHELQSESPAPTEKHLRNRCAIVYLKGLVKELRERVKELENGRA